LAKYKCLLYHFFAVCIAILLLFVFQSRIVTDVQKESKEFYENEFLLVSKPIEKIILFMYNEHIKKKVSRRNGL
ncbi:MAG: hypothetical protein K2N36_07385, partial [Ruminiclostridium sp.]|nr:hypothetical protein [Ruminiclostridium sp.]